VKIATTAALTLASWFFSPAQGPAEEHYIYKDAQGRLVISNQKPPPGSNVLRTFDLPPFRESQMQPVQQSDSTRSTGTLEASPKQEQKK